MSVASDAWDRSWVRRSLLAIGALVAASPLFAWAAGRVGYAEPLENAAERTGAMAHEVTYNPGLLPDYTIPGVDPLVGTFVSAVVGTALTLVVATAIARLLAD
ncbi:PDGLE domain-containing protein [Halomicrobium sp. IBSBa]|uniref:PDGLE domain-containing protein n=1 Tax=Halomicrobium sp. IBSBa TaxID=2778916 RepID=UPI001ABFE0CE|nr:PDGLE domain-containing protein [Halomicrobium sp. IBSBa]MBO4247285.1 PDGLE domain-containing protein [Halomicrobium sp. IBSBa]